MTDEEVKHNVTQKGHPKALYMLLWWKCGNVLTTMA